MRRGGALSVLLALAPVAGVGGGCAGGADGDGIAFRAAPIVYGTDDRREYYELASSDERALMAGSAVGLVALSSLHRSGTQVSLEAPTWGEATSLCPGEPFADQPVAAFCSGVLVDWDLVLTAGHCLRLLALSDFAVVFGYAYDAPGHLAFGPDDVVSPVEIVAEALDPDGIVPRLDYGWLRLQRRVTASRRPASVRALQALTADDAVVSIGSANGVPLKWDSGGRVRDARADAGDYFAASTDTTSGSSGGGAFDSSRSLVGVMARGSDDLVYSDGEGCWRTAARPDGSDAGEQFTYASRALEGLCRANPDASTLCRRDCGDPCRALPPPPDATGCTMGARCSHEVDPLAVLVLLIASGVMGERTNKRG